jgi:cytosine/adenosine deaminase-related metal-dependent hydrolase
VARLVERGLNTGLGTDGAASNNRLDIFGEMRLTALLAKGQSGRAQAVPAWQALQMATLNGAAALGLDAQTGSLESGKQLSTFVADDRTRLDQNLGDLTTVIDANLGVRPVYVTRVDQNELVQLFDRYNLTPLASPVAGNVFRVTPKVSAAPQDQP